MMKSPQTKTPLGDDRGCATGKFFHPLRIDAKTGAIVGAVVFDVETGTTSIVDDDANRCRPESEREPAGQIPTLGQ